MTTFAQPVSMQVTEAQFYQLKPQLKELGYDCVDMDGVHKYLVTNYSAKNNQFSTLWKIEKGSKYNRHFIDHYNPELFLAIAAITTTDNIFIVDEYYVVQNTIGKTKSSFSNNVNFTKPTLQQLINYFTKSESMQPKPPLDKETSEIIAGCEKWGKPKLKVDRNLVIKCANEQEQELVKQWFRNNGEPICEYFNANKFGNYIFFNTGKQWDNTTFSPEHTINGGRTVTPQELGIIPKNEVVYVKELAETFANDFNVSKTNIEWQAAFKGFIAGVNSKVAPTEEFKNGDVVDALLRDVWVSDCRYIGKDTFQKGSIVVGLGEDIRICMEVRKPLKTVTMQQVADKFGYELGTFKIEN